jgi:Zn-dependent protease with chaperone function
VIRLVRACRETNRVTREWQRRAEAVQIEGVTIPAYRFDHDFPVMAVAGIVRPRLFIANKLLRALSPEELAAAAAHEMGHVASRDNLRRALLFLLPDWSVVFGSNFQTAHLQKWIDAAERAADAFAVRGSAQSAVDLAAALVKTARLTSPGMCAGLPPVMQSLVSSDVGIAPRVQRILAMDEAVELHTWPAFVTLPFAVLLAEFWFWPTVLHAAHEAMERFVHLLT